MERRGPNQTQPTTNPIRGRLRSLDCWTGSLHYCIRYSFHFISLFSVISASPSKNRGNISYPHIWVESRSKISSTVSTRVIMLAWNAPSCGLRHRVREFSWYLPCMYCECSLIRLHIICLVSQYHGQENTHTSYENLCIQLDIELF